ncbi:cell division topological specificity factor MinE [bacterium J17]|nr:cell division topological specificity factor MinE [bacterium J17]
MAVFENIRKRLWGKPISKKTAKNRLQMVLVQDRSGLSSQEMDLFRKDLLDVISRYFVLERTSLDIEWQREDACTALVINTPVIGRPHSSRTQAAAG